MLPLPILEFLVSTNVPILPFVAEIGAGTQIGERTDGCARPDHGERRIRASHRRTLADLARVETRVRADDRAATDHGRAGQDRCPGSSSTSSAMVACRSIHVVSGSRMVTPASCQPRTIIWLRRRAVSASCTRSLMPPTIQFSPNRHCVDLGAGRAQQADHIRDVLFALRVVRSDPGELSRSGSRWKT